MDQDRFDDLTRALGQGVSRRQALKLLGGSLAGGLLATLGMGSAAAKDGNSECVAFCKAVFPPGPNRGKCISDAAHGKGLCYDCGPASGGTQYLCGTTCIPNSQPCNGACGPGYKACNGACIPNDATCCAEPSFASTFQFSCFDRTLTCTASGTILSAVCGNSENRLVPASINVNDCSSSDYVISNCGGQLQCGNC